MGDNFGTSTGMPRLMGEALMLLPTAISPLDGIRTGFFPSLDTIEFEEIPPDLLISKFLDALLRRRDFFVSSAWTRHWSSIHALMSLQKPRRYVELGTHHGFSLVSAAKAAEYFEVNCEIIGIDSWEGDHHAGFYGQDVYESVLKQIVQEQLSQTFLVKSSFESALEQFEDGSIDLLHIDGLHTFSSVSRDFREWLPKLSENGVAILHDTRVFDGDFGVHRLWKQLEKEFLSLNLVHGHGLGIVIPSTARTTPIGQLANFLETEVFLTDVVIDATKHISELVCYLAIATHKAAERGERNDKEVATLRSTIAWLENELHRLRKRRVVRLGLGLAKVIRPVFRFVRKLRRKATSG